MFHLMLQHKWFTSPVYIAAKKYNNSTFFFGNFSPQQIQHCIIELIVVTDSYFAHSPGASFLYLVGSIKVQRYSSRAAH